MPKKPATVAQLRKATEAVESAIILLRGERVLLDSDLAEIYGVPTKRLNEQVKRNRRRFPADFAFQLSAPETDGLRSQIATSNAGRGGRRTRPYAFFEHGAIMAANVLSSPRAIAASVLVVRAFVRMRQALAPHGEIARKLEDLERRTDARFHEVFTAIRALMALPPVPRRRKIGFTVPEKSNPKE
ncbi:MAG TPA: ORF6N domain-containing protein [Thermoanaerobaculia bacterium]|nr:ORF6N domain-containing protein [Thermoanaerobaculia bacterium]